MSAVLIYIIAVTGGYLLTYFLDEEQHFYNRVTTGFFIGTPLWGLIGFIYASYLSNLAVWVPFISALVVFLFGVVVFLLKINSKNELINNLKKFKVRFPVFKQNTVYIIIYWILVGIFFHFISSSAFFLKDGEYFTRFSDNYSDATLHSGIVAGFAYGDNFPPIHPDFAGTKLSYPFLINFIAAMMVVTGLRIDQAFYLQYMVNFMLLTLLLRQWSYVLVKNTIASYLTPLIIFFSGGLGFGILFKELWIEKDIWEYLLHLPHEYTNYHELIRWGNSIINWFIPMRSLLLGVPLAVIIFGWWWRIINLKNIHKPLLIGAGIASGLVPLAHTHSYIVIIFVTLVWSVLFKKIKSWMIFGFISLVIALPQLAWIKLGSQADFGTFFGFMNGWVRGNTNFFWFWLANTGIFIPLLIVVMFYPKLIDTKLKKYFVPFLLLFLVGNFIRITPWDWDNNKVLLYWFISCSVPVSYLIVKIFQNSVPGKAVATLLFIILIFSGGLDLMRIVTGVNNWIVFDRFTIYMSNLIKSLPQKSVVVTAPYINNPVLLSGRYTYMGYTGRLWTHGLSYSDREKKVHKMYEGNEAVIYAEDIDYIIVSDAERNWMNDQVSKVNEQFFSKMILVAQVEDRRLFKVR